jgi:hypothetical protein
MTPQDIPGLTVPREAVGQILLFGWRWDERPLARAA